MVVVQMCMGDGSLGASRVGSVKAKSGKFYAGASTQGKAIKAAKAARAGN